MYERSPHLGAASQSVGDIFDCLDKEERFKRLSKRQKQQLRKSIEPGSVLVLDQDRVQDTVLVLEVYEHLESHVRDMVFCLVLTDDGSIEKRLVSVHRIAL